jgi:glycerophosphoryl diester phosphodiesterase
MKHNRTPLNRKKGRNMLLLGTTLVLVVLFLVAFGVRRYAFCSPVEVYWLINTPIAHRGLHTKKAVENSMSAFANAINQGFAIELDLQSTKDYVPMVIHDNDLERLTGIKKKLSQLSADEAKTLKLSNSEDTIPTLQEVLQLVNGRVPLLIEIKAYHIPGRFEQAVIETLKNYNGEFAIQSYNPLACNYIKKRMPEWTVGLLLNDLPKLNSKVARNIKDNLFCLVCSPNFIAYNYSLVNSGMLDIYRNTGTTVLGFVLDPTFVGSEEYKAKVDNIIFEELVTPS